uniref:Uncharacterized protein n=1 Tax=Fagus sylvatica TaxID=28930 RepID=A0A2N9EEA3_FAGSY
MSPCFALLQFNKSISLHSFASPPLYRPIYDMCERSYPKTASWMEDKECCSWDGVECDKTTGHVIGLDLGCSWLYGPIHSNSSLFFLRHLRRLNLAGNHFNHSLLPSEFGKFKSLTHLNLSYSGFSGQIPYEISQLSSLGKLEDNILCLPSLQTLNLGGNWQLEGLLPSSLLNMPMLSELYLYDNQLVGPLPNSFTVFGHVRPRHGNQLSGEIGEFKSNSLEYLDLSVREDSLEDIFVDLRNNLLQGPFPTLNFTGLRYFFVSNNKLSEEIPSSICNASSLEVLDLSHNNLNGMIPKCLIHFSSLSVLDLRMNSLHGTIPARFAKGNKLRNLNLNGNQLEGPLPRSLANCRELQVLDLGNNRINGTFPYWLGSLPNLHVLVLRSNRFHGPIGNPKTKFPFPNLRILDLSTNMFSGPLPGKYFKYFKAMTNVEEGYIPSSFGNLTNLEWLDLSSNKLTGEIPTQLVDLSWLEVLNLSQNQLTGHIPTGKQFNTFENDSYTGNLGLCGYPLSRTCNNHEAKQPPLSTLQQEDNLEPNNGFGWKAVSIGYGCGAIFGMFMGYIMFKIGKPKWLVRMVKLEQHIMLRRLKNNAHRRGGRR